MIPPGNNQLIFGTPCRKAQAEGYCNRLEIFSWSVCPSVRLSVCPSVRPSVRPSICPAACLYVAWVDIMILLIILLTINMMQAMMLQSFCRLVDNKKRLGLTYHYNAISRSIHVQLENGSHSSTCSQTLVVIVQDKRKGHKKLY